VVERMEDRTYYITLGLIFLAAAADVVLHGGTELLFLVRKIFDLMDYLIFWR
jgi:hypothetical protein